MKKFFSLLWQGWKKFAHALGIVNTKILLTISYFIVMGVAAIFSKLFRADLIDRKMPNHRDYWKPRTTPDASLDACRRQF